jgi:hypothetical protein
VYRFESYRGRLWLDDETSTKSRCFNLVHDQPTLKQTIQSVLDTWLVVIDPISSLLGGTDSHKNAEIRRLLAPSKTSPLGMAWPLWPYRIST